MGCQSSKATEVTASAPTTAQQDDVSPSSAKMTLYVNYASPVSRSALMVAAALGIMDQVDVKILDLMKGEHKSEEYLKINPNGTVPTLVDGETIICQSRDIARHLATTCAEGNTLYPTELKQQIDDILTYDSDHIFPSMVALIVGPILMGQGPPPPSVYDDVKAAMLHINGVIGENDYLTGSAITIADFFVFNDLAQTAMDTKLEKPDGVDALKAWGGRMKGLPCVDGTHQQFVAIMEHFAATAAEAAASSE